MSSVIDEPSREDRVRPRHGLPPIGIWWPMLERHLQQELLENLDAPLRAYVVLRIFELCDLEGEPVPRASLRLGMNERAYIAGWAHAVDWN